MKKIICKKNNWTLESGGVNLTNGMSGIVINEPDVRSYKDKLFTIDFNPLLTNSPFLNIEVDYEYFRPEKLTEDQLNLIKQQEITFNQAKESIEKDSKDIENKSGFDIFVRFKENSIEDARKLVFGETKIIVDIDDTEIQFVGAVINVKRNINDSIQLLESLEPYIENIFI